MTLTINEFRNLDDELFADYLHEQNSIEENENNHLFFAELNWIKVEFRFWINDAIVAEILEEIGAASEEEILYGDWGEIIDRYNDNYYCGILDYLIKNDREIIQEGLIKAYKDYYKL